MSRAKMISGPGQFSPSRPHSKATIRKMKAAAKKRAMVWVRTIETKDALLVTICAKRGPDKP